MTHDGMRFKALNMSFMLHFKSCHLVENSRRYNCFKITLIGRLNKVFASGREPKRVDALDHRHFLVLSPLLSLKRRMDRT